MVNEFWKYWKQRWPNASSDENKLRNSANYQETRAAFLAGFEAAQQSFEADPLCGYCHRARNPIDAVLCHGCGHQL